MRETTRPSQTAKREETKAAIVAIVSALVECSDDAVYDEVSAAAQDTREPRTRDWMNGAGIAPQREGRAGEEGTVDEVHRDFAHHAPGHSGRG